MPTVTILSRQITVSGVDTGRGVEQVQITYSSNVTPPRTILLPVDRYRPATPQEIQANPRYLVVPRDTAAQDAELAAIKADIDSIQAGRPQTFTIT